MANRDCHECRGSGSCIFCDGGETDDVCDVCNGSGVCQACDSEEEKIIGGDLEEPSPLDAFFDDDDSDMDLDEDLEDDE